MDSGPAGAASSAINAAFKAAVTGSICGSSSSGSDGSGAVTARGAGRMRGRSDRSGALAVTSGAAEGFSASVTISGAAASRACTSCSCATSAGASCGAAAARLSAPRFVSTSGTSMATGAILCAGRGFGGRLVCSGFCALSSTRGACSSTGGKIITSCTGATISGRRKGRASSVEIGVKSCAN